MPTTDSSRDIMTTETSSQRLDFDTPALQRKRRLRAAPGRRNR